MKKAIVPLVETKPGIQDQYKTKKYTAINKKYIKENSHNSTKQTKEIHKRLMTFLVSNAKVLDTSGSCKKKSNIAKLFPQSQQGQKGSY